MIDYIQIALLIYLIDRTSIERNRFKIGIHRGAIWIFEKRINGTAYYIKTRIFRFKQ